MRLKQCTGASIDELAGGELPKYDRIGGGA
jgi:hypothetical protein